MYVGYFNLPVPTVIAVHKIPTVKEEATWHGVYNMYIHT